MNTEEKLAQDIMDALNELRDAHSTGNIKLEERYIRHISKVLLETEFELVIDKKGLYKIVLKS